GLLVAALQLFEGRGQSESSPPPKSSPASSPPTPPPQSPPSSRSFIPPPSSSPLSPPKSPPQSSAPLFDAVAKREASRSAPFLPHFGHSAETGTSPERMIFSNFLRHSPQRNS